MISTFCLPFQYMFVDTFLCVIVCLEIFLCLLTFTINNNELHVIYLLVIHCLCRCICLEKLYCFSLFINIYIRSTKSCNFLNETKQRIWCKISVFFLNDEFCLVLFFKFIWFFELRKRAAGTKDFFTIRTDVP